MKNLLLRFGFFLPAAIFAVYVLMIIIGCAASCFGAGDAFYCGAFCKVGMSLITLVAIYMIYKSVRELK